MTPTNKLYAMYLFVQVINYYYYSHSIFDVTIHFNNLTILLNIQYICIIIYIY